MDRLLADPKVRSVGLQQDPGAHSGVVAGGGAPCWGCFKNNKSWFAAAAAHD